MKNYYTMLIERDEEGWYVGCVPSLPGCHTQGRTIDELVSNMEEAISLYAEEESRAAISEADKILCHHGARFQTVSELFDDLEKNAGR